MVIFHHIGPFKEVTPALNMNVFVVPLHTGFIASFFRLSEINLSSVHLSASLSLQLFSSFLFFLLVIPVELRVECRIQCVWNKERQQK